MRNQPPLQERHLQEAVRRNVISSDQYDSILALARTMAHAEGNSAPDLGWLALFNAAVCALLVGGGAIWVLANHERWLPFELLGAGVVLLVASLGAATLAKRFSMGQPARGIFAAGAAAFAWALAVAVSQLATSHPISRSMLSYDSFGYEQHRLFTDRVYIVADLVVLVAALIAYRALRAPSVAAVGALAFGHGWMTLAEHLQRQSGSSLSDREAVPYLIALCVLLCGAAFGLERVQRKSSDPAFWVHSLGILALGVAGLIRIDRGHGESPVWIMLAGAVLAFGLKVKRRSYALAGATALVIYPTYALADAHAPSEIVGAAFLSSTAAIAIGGAALRRHYLRTRFTATTPRVADDATVWAE